MNCVLKRLTFFLALALAGCKPETYDECLQTAAKEAKSVAALEILKGVCEREHAAERQLIKNVGKNDKVSLTTPWQFLSGSPSLRITRSTVERTDNGLKASVEQLFPAAEMKKEVRRLFDPQGVYDSFTESQLETVGLKEYDCKNGRMRWIESDIKLYIDRKKDPQAVLRVADDDFRKINLDALSQWVFIDRDSVPPDFEYLCQGHISPDVVAVFGYENICGPSFAEQCVK